MAATDVNVPAIAEKSAAPRVVAAAFRPVFADFSRHGACPYQGAMSAPVIAAIDLGPLTGRILLHAAAFARLLQVPLKVLHVSGDGTEALREQVLKACLQLGPYQEDFHENQIVIRHGHVSEAIAREAVRDRATLIVIGSRAHNRLSKLLLGSTSERVLANATTPVLLVPPIDMDIVSFDDSATLTCGPVIAAVDLSENSTEQMRLAAKLAAIGRQPLLMMTVAKSRVTNHVASQQLRDRAHALDGAQPKALILRRGGVAEEISRCALVEGAGLVVMGLRGGPRGQPGVIASAVLRTRRAFVLAVPNRTGAPARRAGAGISKMIAALLLVLAGAGIARAQHEWGNPGAVAAFQRAADGYAFLHRQAERQLGLSHRAAGLAQTPIETAELAAAIRAARAPSAGSLFSDAIVEEFRTVAARAVRQGCDAGELRTGVWQTSHAANSNADGSHPIPACLVGALPPLPTELEYRSAGTVLLVVDGHASIVVDALPALLAGMRLR